jgi:hypothetical protein
VAGLHITSGQVAFDVETTQGGLIEALMARIDDCDMHGQTTAAVRLSATGNARSSVMLHHCEFHNLQRAILIDDQGVGGFSMLHAMHCHFDAVQTGCEASVSASGGAMSMAMFDRSECNARRPATSNTWCACSTATSRRAATQSTSRATRSA